MSKEITSFIICILAVLAGVLIVIRAILHKVNKSQKQLSRFTPQWHLTPKAAKDVAAHNQAIVQQENERIKRMFAPLYPQ